MGKELKHYLNPLHVYCRLRDGHCPKGIAMFLIKIYEIGLFRPITGINL